MKTFLTSWPFWALLSAGFAALTAIFAKVGVENVNSDFTTFFRTIVILLAAGLMLYITGNWQEPSSVSPRSWLFLVLSGLATGASWICYFPALKLGDAARVAPSTSCLWSSSRSSSYCFSASACRSRTGSVSS